MGKIKLNVLGISYSQTQSGAYALVLSEEEGNRRIPIIVGGFEAQAIAIELEGLAPPRPLTHDLFKNFAESYGGQRMILDARTSDAIALALRFSCPIYTTDEIVEKAGIVLDFEKGTEFEHPGASQDEESEVKIDKPKKGASKSDLSKTSMDDLRSMLAEAVSKEDYEKASEIRDEINRRSR
jgi:hypothetical protein